MSSIISSKALSTVLGIQLMLNESVQEWSQCQVSENEETDGDLMPFIS